jgi:hypothetical protein
VVSHVGSSVYHPVVMACDPRSTHPMVTRRATGVTNPVNRLQLSTTTTPSTLSLVPTSVCSALTNPHWCHAMEEYETLLSKSTWDLVPQPPKANVITDKWILMHKLEADGSLDRYKVLVAGLLLSLRERMTPGVGAIFWFISHTMP